MTPSGLKNRRIIDEGTPYLYRYTTYVDWLLEIISRHGAVWSPQKRSHLS